MASGKRFWTGSGSAHNWPQEASVFLSMVGQNIGQNSCEDSWGKFKHTLAGFRCWDEVKLRWLEQYCVKVPTRIEV